MPSLDSVLTRSYLKQGVAQYTSDDTVADSGPVALRLRYLSTGTVTSVTVTTGTSLVTISEDNATTDTFLFATYDTLGTLVDAINAAGNFEAKILDSLRSYPTKTQFTNGAITSSVKNGITVWDVLVDTSAAAYIASRLTFDRVFDKSHKTTHRVALQEIKYAANVTTTDYVYVYEVDKVGTETLKYKIAAVDATTTTLNFAAGVGKITAQDGQDLVVVVKSALDASTPPIGDLANGCFVQLVGELE